ncbi:MAG: hypothetical protein J0I42_09780 [Bosea sp.]|uniref:hypothetical protein n=1 Tax=Bosea sp. (in: a-proteobacteria) TaxID=1871050 RepID=UPI001AD48621|nr:hypothetical protein [Bosea sp. (in: a-proteobacteria)]MBN9452228.1 hypothetical protein [Bosea sp. (in: a-proteobacteria)]
MSLTGTVRIPAQAAVVALFQSHLLEGHPARAEIKRMALSAEAGRAARTAAFGSSDPMIAAAIRDRIAYSERADDLYVKPDLLGDAIATLSAIALAAGSEAGRLEGEAIARTAQGGDPDPDDARKVAVVRTLERDAGILMGLAHGARIAAPAHEDGRGTGT